MPRDTEALVTKTDALDYLHRIRTDPSAWVPSIDAVQELASTVVALHDGVERLKRDVLACEKVRNAARTAPTELGPLDRVEWTWPDDFEDPAGDKPECTCAACGDTVSVEWGMEWAQGRDVCSDCAQMRSDALSAVTRERDSARLELRRLRAAEAPGTDDEAFGGTGWEWLDGEWQRPEGPPVWKHNGVWFTRVAGKVVRFTVAIDAMRAAVPESV